MGDLLKGWETPKSAFEMLKKCTKGMPCDITGVTYEMREGKNMEGSRGIQWPFREGDVIDYDERRLFEDGGYCTPNKKAKFMFEDPAENPTLPTEEYPYILNSGRGSVGQWHTGVRSREIDASQLIYPSEPYVLMNELEAKALGISLNDKITIESSNGVAREFTVKLTPGLKSNHLYAPIHYIEANALTPSIYDPYSKEPSFKTVPVKIIKK